jgi:hypothetical protein
MDTHNSEAFQDHKSQDTQGYLNFRFYFNTKRVETSTHTHYLSKETQEVRTATSFLFMHKVILPCPSSMACLAPGAVSMHRLLAFL